MEAHHYIDDLGVTYFGRDDVLVVVLVVLVLVAVSKISLRSYLLRLLIRFWFVSNVKLGKLDCSFLLNFL